MHVFSPVFSAVFLWLFLRGKQSVEIWAEKNCFEVLFPVLWRSVSNQLSKEEQKTWWNLWKVVHTFETFETLSGGKSHSSYKEMMNREKLEKYSHLDEFIEVLDLFVEFLQLQVVTATVFQRRHQTRQRLVQWRRVGVVTPIHHPAHALQWLRQHAHVKQARFVRVQVEGFGVGFAEGAHDGDRLRAQPPPQPGAAGATVRGQQVVVVVAVPAVEHRRVLHVRRDTEPLVRVSRGVGTAATASLSQFHLLLRKSEMHWKFCQQECSQSRQGASKDFHAKLRESLLKLPVWTGP